MKKVMIFLLVLTLTSCEMGRKVVVNGGHPTVTRSINRNTGNYGGGMFKKVVVNGNHPTVTRTIHKKTGLYGKYKKPEHVKKVHPANKITGLYGN